MYSNLNQHAKVVFLKNFKCFFILFFFPKSFPFPLIQHACSSPLQSSPTPAPCWGPRVQDSEGIRVGLLTAGWDCGAVCCRYTSELEETPASRVAITWLNNSATWNDWRKKSKVYLKDLNLVNFGTSCYLSSVNSLLFCYHNIVQVCESHETAQYGHSDCFGL